VIVYRTMLQVYLNGHPRLHLSQSKSKIHQNMLMIKRITSCYLWQKKKVFIFKEHF